MQFFPNIARNSFGAEIWGAGKGGEAHGVGLILGTRDIKDRRILTCLGSNYWGAAESENFGRPGSSPCQSPSIVPMVTHLFARG